MTNPTAQVTAQGHRARLQTEALSSVTADSIITQQRDVWIDFVSTFSASNANLILYPDRTVYGREHLPTESAFAHGGLGTVTFPQGCCTPLARWLADHFL